MSINNTGSILKQDSLTHTLSQQFHLLTHLATGALLQVYLAKERLSQTKNTTGQTVLLLVVNPAISELPDFHAAWQQYFTQAQPTAPSYPHLLNWGELSGYYWMTCAYPQGQLLLDTLQMLDERGMSVDQALLTTRGCFEAISHFQASAFGYMEPSALFKKKQGYIVLNAPIALILHYWRRHAGSTLSPLSLHSPYISPSAAVGDAPIHEDDTFSAASLFYHCLTGQTAFDKQSTLIAAARGDQAIPTQKLRKTSWETLKRGLSLQRSQRPSSAQQLLKTIQQANRPKLFLPIAASLAAGVLIYTVYYLTTQVDDLLALVPERPVPEKIQNKQQTSRTELGSTNKQTTQASNPVPQEQNSGNTVDNPVVGVATNEISASAQDDMASITPDSLTEESTTTPTIKQLLDDAQKLLSESTPEPELSASEQKLLSQVRKAQSLDQQAPELIQLLQQLIERRTRYTETLLSQQQLEKAKATLASTDALVREFALLDQIEVQVKLESRLTDIQNQQHEHTQIEGWLADTRQAIQADQLIQKDNTDDYALAHLNKVLFIEPEHAEGLALMQVLVEKIQANTRRKLKQGDKKAAQIYLLEAERLIEKHNLHEAKAQQALLNKDYYQSTKKHTTSPASVPTHPSSTTTWTQNTTPRAHLTRQEIPQPHPSTTSSVSWGEPTPLQQSQNNRAVPMPASASTVAIQPVYNAVPTPQAQPQPVTGDYYDPFGPSVEANFALPPKIEPYQKVNTAYNPTPAPQALYPPVAYPAHTPNNNGYTTAPAPLLEVPIDLIDNSISNQ
ncbi:MAG: hypothetical protein CR991_06875 [Proteobacteria bacterium]|nr:MAG: hypothetical protein CR991_06875 [Pseudomonadota bacterium]